MARRRREMFKETAFEPAESFEPAQGGRAALMQAPAPVAPVAPVTRGYTGEQSEASKALLRRAAIRGLGTTQARERREAVAAAPARQAAQAARRAEELRIRHVEPVEARGEAALGVAGIQAGAQRDVAGIGAGARTQVAETQAETQQYVAGKQYDRAVLDDATRQKIGQLEAQTSKAVAQIRAGGRATVQQQAALADIAGSHKTIAAITNAMIYTEGDPALMRQLKTVRDETINRLTAAHESLSAPEPQVAQPELQAAQAAPQQERFETAEEQAGVAVPQNISDVAAANVKIMPADEKAWDWANAEANKGSLKAKTIITRLKKTYNI